MSVSFDVRCSGEDKHVNALCMFAHVRENVLQNKECSPVTYNHASYHFGALTPIIMGLQT